jgi:hypothetical protein
MTYLNDTAPEVNGFPAGTSYKNTIIYVGRAWFENKVEYQPGRIDLTTKSIYGTYSGEKTTTNGIEYLVKPNGCNCSWMAPAVANKSEGMVRAGDINYHYVIGRASLGNNQYAISEVRLSDFKQWYSTSSTAYANFDTKEILVCETNDDNSVPPEFTPANVACGKLNII